MSDGNGRLSWSWLVRGIPVMGPAAFGVFRVAFAFLLGVLVLSVWEGDIPVEAQRAVPIAALDWIGRFAASPSGMARLQHILILGLVLFAAGLYTRTVYVLLAVLFNLWFCALSLRGVIHFLGPLPIAMLLLMLAPWHEGAGVDRWRSGAPDRSRMPAGFAPWVLCLACSVAFVAGGYAKGAQWAMNGTVRYHFMAEADLAWVPWGLWVAARPALSVAVSWTVVILEHLAALAPFLLWRGRFAIGVAAAGLLIGFALLHNALWPAWWVLVLGFVPWQRVSNLLRVPTSGRQARTLIQVPLWSLVPLVVLPAQQIVASSMELEAGPYLSAYDMYSVTFESPEAFEQANGRLRFRMVATTPAGDVDVGGCVRAEEAAIRELDAAVMSGVDLLGIPGVRRRVMACSAGAGALRVRILADQRFFDWEHGRTGWKFRDRLVGDWPVVPSGESQPRGPA